jgi:hypothetical protein
MEWHIPDIVLVQLILLTMSTGVLETCTELEKIYMKKNLVKFLYFFIFLIVPFLIIYLKFFINTFRLLLL